MKFTAHNIDLGNGKTTMEGPLWEDLPRCKAVIKSLNLYFEPAVRPTIRIADLGALEGGYAVAMAREGYQVVGVEARKSNVDNCLYVQEHLKMLNLSFVQDDVKNIQKYGKFDVYVCNGLLYHLDEPASFLRLLGDMKPKMLILDTHYAWAKDPFYDFLPFLNKYKGSMARRLPFLPKKYNYALSTVKINDGKKGRWFREYNKNASNEQIEKSLWASFSNNKSFWLVKQDLLQSIKEAGFSIIYEQHDRFDDMHDTYREKHDRSLFICFQ